MSAEFRLSDVASDTDLQRGPVEFALKFYFDRGEPEHKYGCAIILRRGTSAGEVAWRLEALAREIRRSTELAQTSSDEAERPS